MKVVVLYRSNSEHERSVLEFERDYNRITGRQLSLLDINTREGWALASLYDVVRYPAVLAMGDAGELLQIWTDDSLPLMNEVMYYDKATA